MGVKKIKKIKLGPYDWTIEEKEDLKDFGECSFSDLKININKNVSKDVFISTLFHELCHAAFFSGGISLRQEELIVDSLASQILFFIKNNPKYIKYIQKLFKEAYKESKGSSNTKPKSKKQKKS